MITLRPYQSLALTEISTAFKQGHKRVLFQLPTGGGKTILATEMLRRAAERGKKGLFLCNRKELIDQTSVTFDMVGLPHGIISAAHKPKDVRAPVQIGSVDTIRCRLEYLNIIPDMIIWDECRGLGAKGWTRVYESFPFAYHVGLDATPERLDGKGLGDYFTHLVAGPTIQELIAIGALVPPKIYTPTIPDLSEVRTQNGDFEKKSLARAMGQSRITGSAVETYKRIGFMQQGLVFCATVEHSKQVAAEFTEAGIQAVHLDAKTPPSERASIVRVFREGGIRLICNVDLFTAGFDVPGVRYIASLRPTKSITVYLQQCGRGARPDSGKTHYILADHAGNFDRFGAPHADRAWSLEGRKKRQNATNIPMRRCEMCFHVYSPVPACPECGHENAPVARGPEMEEGELVEVTDPLTRKKEEEECATLKDWHRLARRRGYSPGWAYIRWNQRRQNHG